MTHFNGRFKSKNLAITMYYFHFAFPHNSPKLEISDNASPFNCPSSSMFILVLVEIVAPLLPLTWALAVCFISSPLSVFVETLWWAEVCSLRNLLPPTSAYALFYIIHEEKRNEQEEGDEEGAAKERGEERGAASTRVAQHTQCVQLHGHAIAIKKHLLSLHNRNVSRSFMNKKKASLTWRGTTAPQGLQPWCSGKVSSSSFDDSPSSF